MGEGNARDLINAGATILVAGTSVFKAEDYGTAIGAARLSRLCLSVPFLTCFPSERETPAVPCLWG